MPTKNKGEEIGSKLRVRIESHEPKILEQAVKQIFATGSTLEAKMVGPIPLPTLIKKYTVNRSSFVYKDAREQFEMRIHTRVVDIIEPTARLIEALGNIDIPSSVNIKVKMLS